MNKFFKSPWTISIGSTIIGFLLTIGYDAIKGKQIFSTIGTILATICKWIHTFLTFNLKLWWILLGIVVLFIILFFISKIIEKRNFEPEYINYTEDNFGSLKWTWYWEYDKTIKKWHISKLEPHCPECDTPMFSNGLAYIGYDYKCPRCHHISQIYTQEHEIEKVIFDNLHRRAKEKY